MNFKRIPTLPWSKKSKIIRIMKLFSIFMLAFMLGANATSFSQKQHVSLDLKQCDLNTLFLEIWKQTGLRFVYNTEHTLKISRFDIKVEEEEVENVLRKVLDSTPLKYTFERDVIFVTPKTIVPQAKETKVKLHGKVTDSDGYPLPGVSVFVEKSTVGVATDINGKYELSLSKDSTVNIVYSFIGMETVVFKFMGNKDIEHNVVMQYDKLALDDVVVIGYGAKSKYDITSSVSSISGEDMKKYNNGSITFDNLLGGAIKGVLVQQSSGQPGAASTINIRGITSPVSGSTNEPLYVIDGVPFFADKNSNMLNPLMTISPNDIKSIDVLKDAAATAIYGSRGANGVVIINTVSGRRNQKMSINAGYTLSVGNPIKKYKPLNRSEFINLQDEIIRSTLDAAKRGQVNISTLTTTPGFMDKEIAEMMDMPYLGVSYTYDNDGSPVPHYNKINVDAFGKADTDWVKETQNKNALTHQYNVGVRGGSESTNYSLSINAINQEGSFIHEKLERYGARLSVDSDISKRFTTGASLNYTYAKRKLGSDIYGYVTGVDKAWTFRPDVPVKNEDGTWATADGSFYWGAPYKLVNPVASRAKQNNANSYQFMGSSYLEYRVIDGLKVRGDINISIFDNVLSLFTPTYTTDDFDSYYGEESKNSGSEDKNSLTNSSISFRADYDLYVDKHHAAFMVGYSWDRTFSEFSRHSYHNYPDDYVLTNVSSAGSVLSHSGSKNTSGLNSVYSRISYNYDDKYLAEFNFRSDISSKFGPGNKRAYFPALSLGWRISHENFMEKVTVLDDLKLRFSVGQTGSTNVDDFTYRQFFTRSSDILYQGEPGIVPGSTFPNNDVKWEMTTEYNAGIDFSFFGQRLFGSIDAYYRFTNGALAPSPLPYETGATLFSSNLMDMSNRGMELEIGGNIIQNKDITWTSKLNLSFNRNRVEKFNNANLNSWQTEAYKEGKPAGILLGYVVEKIFRTDEEVAQLNAKAHEKNPNVKYYDRASTGAGDYKYKDLNGDGRITDEDREILATPEPKFFGGFMNTVSYKNFNLSVVFQFSQGTKALLGELNKWTSLGNTIQREMYGNTWTTDNKDARYARIVQGNPSRNTRTSDKFVFNSSYLRLKNVSLSYSVPQTVLNKLNIQSAMLFASVSNLWTLTKWPGLDPEVLDSQRGFAGYTTNDDPYPLSRNFSIGVQLAF